MFYYFVKLFKERTLTDQLFNRQTMIDYVKIDYRMKG